MAEQPVSTSGEVNDEHLNDENQSSSDSRQEPTSHPTSDSPAANPTESREAHPSHGVTATPFNDDFVQQYPTDTRHESLNHAIPLQSYHAAPVRVISQLGRFYSTHRQPQQTSQRHLPDPIHSQLTNQMHEPGPTHPQLTSQMHQPIPQITQPGPAHTQFTPQMHQPGPTYHQQTPQTSQPIPRNAPGYDAGLNEVMNPGVVEPTMFLIPARNWSSDILDCCGDDDICFRVLCCSCCVASQVASDMGESCYMPFVVPTWLLILRNKLRVMQLISGDSIEDCFLTCFCAPCSLCQLAREIKHCKATGQLRGVWDF